ncbi:hypothetical protein [Nitrobacter sp. TKz-YC01]|uniref:hypothetical protein n=1 Tax=Nitrobacter sp. TKz-YC01 TaxID=3398703 RepID=UPI003A100863
MTLAAASLAVGARTPNQSGWRISVCLQISGRTFDAINPAHNKRRKEQHLPAKGSSLEKERRDERYRYGGYTKTCDRIH